MLDETEHLTLDKLDRLVEPKFDPDEEKLTKELKLIEYEVLVAEYIVEMENHGDFKKDGHDKPPYENLVHEPAYGHLVPAEKVMAPEEYLAAIPKNNYYYRILERAWEEDGQAEPACKNMEPAIKTEYNNNSNSNSNSNSRIIPPRLRAPTPGLERVSFKTGTPTAVIFLIENTIAPQ